MRHSELRSSIVIAVAWVSAMVWVQALARELPCATGVAKKKKKQKKKKNKKKKNN